MQAPRDRTAARMAGAWAGVAGLLAFLVVHNLLIIPIWSILPVGLPVAAIAGVAVGNAFADLQPHLPRRPWTAPAFALVVGVILLPAFILAERHGPIFDMTSPNATLLIPESDALRLFAVELLGVTGLAGAIVGWGVARTRSAAMSTGLAGLAFAIGPGHNIPFLGGTPAVGRELILVASILAVASVVLVEVQRRVARAV